MNPLQTLHNKSSLISSKISLNDAMDSHQQQQKQNQEGNGASQAYDHQSYYNNYYYYTQQQQYSYQQYASYYNTHYANSHQNLSQQEVTHPQPSSELPPGVSPPPPQTAEHGGGVVSGEVQVESQQKGYYQVGPGGDQSGTVQSGMNPVVAAAAMVLAQFSGTVAAGGLQGQVWNPGVGGGFRPVVGGPGIVSGAEQSHILPGPIHPPVGGGPFQGTARGNFSRHLSGRGRSGSSFRGRGHFRGRGGPRSVRTHEALSSPQLKPSDSGGAESIEKGEGSSANSHEEEAKGQVLPQTMAPTIQQSSRVAWCELCRVECTSLEILEKQHKTGKRHQKNLQKMEKLRIANEPVAKIKSAQIPAGGSNTDETLKPGNLLQSEQDKQSLTENSTSEAGSHENKLAIEPHSDEAKQPDNSAEPQDNAHSKEPSMNLSSNQRQGMKRKMRDGRGGKRMKQEPRQPKVVIPLICDLCNVRCDTQEVFDRHLSGKKHISKLKRYEGHQATYGSTGVQVLYPPNPISQTLLNQGSQQGLHLQHTSYPPPGTYVPPETNHSAPATTLTVPSIQQNPNIQVSNPYPSGR